MTSTGQPAHDRAGRPLRLPLSCGDGRFRMVTVASVGGAVAFGPLFSSALPSWGPALVSALAVGWALLVVVVASATWRRRASDVCIDATGVSILSGPRHGLHLGWPEVAGQVHARAQGAQTVLSVGPLVLAETRDPDEAASLGALAATLTASASDRVPDGPLGPEVVVCQRCGAALVPEDRPSVSCRFCQASTALPEKVQHAAGAPQAEAAVQAAVRTLLRWPHAATVNRWLGASIVIAVLAWPAMAACAQLLLPEGASLLDRAVLAACAATASITLPSLVALAVEQRRSFEMLSARFAALPPGPDAPHGCRCCGGPLADPHGRATTPMVGSCAYCKAINVVGLGLSREARASRDDAASLPALAAARASRRRRLWLRAALPLWVIAWTPWHFSNALGMAPVCLGPVGIGGGCVSSTEAQRCIDGVPTRLRCEGPSGCSTTGLRTSCDQSAATVGDACLGGERARACSVGGDARLTCTEGRWAVASTCRGPAGCSLGADGAVACDASIVAVGDPCGDTEAHACSADGGILRCRERVFQPLFACRGPGGCTSAGGRVRCDRSLALEGDACEPESGACSVDGASLLHCVDGTFAVSEACPGGCRPEGDRALCRLRR